MFFSLCQSLAMFCHGFPTYPLKVSILYINCLTWFYMSQHRMRPFLPWFQSFTSPRHILGDYDDDYMILYVRIFGKALQAVMVANLGSFPTFSKHESNELKVGCWCCCHQNFPRQNPAPFGSLFWLAWAATWHECPEWKPHSGVGPSQKFSKPAQVCQIPNKHCWLNGAC